MHSMFNVHFTHNQILQNDIVLNASKSLKYACMYACMLLRFLAKRHNPFFFCTVYFNLLEEWDLRVTIYNSVFMVHGEKFRNETHRINIFSAGYPPLNFSIHFNNHMKENKSQLNFFIGEWCWRWRWWVW